MSVFFITLILFVVFFVVKVRKVLAEPFQESEQISDLEEIVDEEDALHKEVLCNNVVAELHREEDKISEQVGKEEKQILVEQDKKFSLKEAVIYSAILERPYK